METDGKRGRAEATSAVIVAVVARGRTLPQRATIAEDAVRKGRTTETAILPLQVPQRRTVRLTTVVATTVATRPSAAKVVNGAVVVGHGSALRMAAEPGEDAATGNGKATTPASAVTNSSATYSVHTLRALPPRLGPIGRNRGVLSTATAWALERTLTSLQTPHVAVTAVAR